MRMLIWNHERHPLDDRRYQARIETPYNTFIKFGGKWEVYKVGRKGDERFLGYVEDRRQALMLDDGVKRSRCERDRYDESVRPYDTELGRAVHEPIGWNRRKKTSGAGRKRA